MNRQHRLAPAPSKTHRPSAPVGPSSGQAAGQFLLISMVAFCAVAWLLMQWGSRHATNTAAHTSAEPPVAAQVLLETVVQPLPTEAGAPVTTLANPPVQNPQQPAPVSPYNPDLWGTLGVVLEQEGQGLLLVGGSVVGGVALLLLAVRHMTRIPKDPLESHLGRTLTLLENDHRAGNLTPQRALAVARQAVADLEAGHTDAIRTRTAEFEATLTRMQQAHANTLAAVKQEAAHALRQAQRDTKETHLRAERAEGRIVQAETQIAGLSRDLDTAHIQIVEQRTNIQAQADELAQMHRAMTDAADTLAEWKTAHTELHARYTALSTIHADLKAQQKDLEAKAQAAKATAEQAEQEATDVRSRNEVLEQEKDGLSAERDKLSQEVSRLQGVSLRELPIVIPDREGDLAPHMASLVAFIRGTTMDTGAAGGERTTKPVLSSWRDIRRLFQVLKGVGLRFAVPAHHTPRWVEGAAEAGGKGEEVQVPATDKQPAALPRKEEHCSQSALTDSQETVHNGGLSRDFNTSDADVLPLLTV
jgi:hypothetical protein